MKERLLGIIENSIKINWNLPAFTDYKGISYTYKETAEKIEKLKLLFGEWEIKKGDKIAFCSRNTAHWGITYLAILSYGAVAVPVPYEFKPIHICQIITHCEAKLFLVGSSIYENLYLCDLSYPEAIIRMEDFSFISTKDKNRKNIEDIHKIFESHYPIGFTSAHLQYRQEENKELAMICYTSGTDTNSRGVMLTYQNLLSNLCFINTKNLYKQGEKLISVMPLAHIYGVSFELLFPFCNGSEICFINSLGSWRNAKELFSFIRPHLIITVPGIIEKVIKKFIYPTLEKRHIKLLSHLPFFKKQIRERTKKRFVSNFGGRFRLLAVGGAPFNDEIEAFLASVNFPYTVSYGMTECAPLIAYDDWHTFRIGSSGKPVDRMQVRIQPFENDKPEGEIWVKGDNVMAGYYQNLKGTHKAFDKEGWFYTGDIGIFDEAGYLYIKGRCSNIITTTGGHYIYPEEIEEKLNILPYIQESLILQQNDKLIAYIYPDFSAARQDGLKDEAITCNLEKNRRQINEILPSYSRIAAIRIKYHPFEKTPKQSIKRYLYK